MNTTTVTQQLEELGFSISSQLIRDEFCPHDRKGQSVWNCVISRNGKSESFEYSMGAAYREMPRPLSRNRWEPVQPYLMRKLNVGEFDRLKKSRPTQPEMDGVIYAIHSDSFCSDQSFEDFCCELGYDTDSISDKKTWEACRDNMFKFCNLASDLTDQLQEIFQDF